MYKQAWIDLLRDCKDLLIVIIPMVLIIYALVA